MVRSGLVELDGGGDGSELELRFFKCFMRVYTRIMV